MTETTSPGSSIQVLSIEAGARLAGVSTQTFRRICKNGHGPTLIRLSPRRIGIRVRDLDAWLSSRAVGAEEAA